MFKSKRVVWIINTKSRFCGVVWVWREYDAFITRRPDYCNICHARLNNLTNHISLLIAYPLEPLTSFIHLVIRDLRVCPSASIQILSVYIEFAYQSQGTGPLNIKEHSIILCWNQRETRKSEPFAAVSISWLCLLPNSV